MVACVVHGDMPTLAEATTPARTGETFHLEVSPGWRQGRGAFGGLSIAAMIRAAEARIDDPTRTVRSVTAELFAPVEVGAAELPVERLRHGNSLSAVRVAMIQGAPKAHAVVILAASRSGASPLAWLDVERPETPSWRELTPSPIGVPGREARWPEFTQHFEYRLVEGLPMTRGEPRTVGWVRPRDPGPARDAGYVAAMIDAWFPAALVKFPTPRSIATIAFTLELVAGLDGLDPDAPLLYRGVVQVCADGYFLETRELWGEDGRLVAINHQTFAILD